MFLLDTNILIYLQTRPEKLSKEVLGILKERENLLFVSTASLWEVSIKHKKGLLPMGKIIVEDYQKILREYQLNELVISGKHAIKAGQLEMIHRDPFDRLIIAQAMLEQITVLTLDKIFKSYPISVIN